jgi:hypothetical protein
MNGPRCPQCGQTFAPGAQFCPQHGPLPAAPPPNGERLPLEERLAKLKTLLDGGLISEDDFNHRKEAILAEI